MKLAIFALLLCSMGYVVYSQQVAGKYTTKYDNIKLDEILANKKLVQFYVQCLIGKKQCNNEGQTLKDLLDDALKTKCSKCNEKQRDGAYRAIDKLQTDYPEEWNLLTGTWDPTGEYFKQFKAEQVKYLKKQR